ncbi:hypothetical protein CLV00_0149 [Flavobacterium sp. 11]|nr:hypothetical protein CLV00_0149 [Flavobacterium sp. 11]
MNLRFQVCTVVTRFLFIKCFFSFVLIQKKQKINPEYFLSQKSSDVFSYPDPSRSCFTLDSRVTPFCQRLNSYRDFLVQKYKGNLKGYNSKFIFAILFLLMMKNLYFFISLNFYYKLCLLCLFVSLGWLNLRFVLITHELLIYWSS